MRHAAIATSVRLPLGADEILEKLIKNLKISKARFIREAVIEKIEDMLDIQEIQKVLAKKEKTYSMEELKREFGLES
ncbi:MAG: CopG family transcriptional regulator [Burkholderiales bacterium]|jgi:predicted DNA-binding protein|nr:CopG family transcriptional regulator [Burkholderiales bacterium]